MKKLLKLSLILAITGMIYSCEKDTDLPKDQKEEIKTYEGWQLIWNDEFDSTVIDEAKWVYEIGDGTDYGLPAGWGNAEKQIYTNSNDNSGIVMDESRSVLAITAREENTDEYSSAKLTTENLFTSRFGRIEIKAKLPKGQGIWPAFWMLGNNKDLINWPGCGEIDIIEVLGHEPNKMYSTLHFTNENNEHGEVQNSYTLQSGDFSDNYHSFTMDWTPDSLGFSLDGQLLKQMPIEDDMKEFQRSFYLILNIAVGGYWPGDPDETTVFPQTMYIDYIRVYSKNDLEIPVAPELNMVEETVGQYIEPNIGENAIRVGYKDLGALEVITYGPGAPLISTSDTAINGNLSLVFDFPGTNWGGGYIQLNEGKDLSSYTHLKFAFNKPEEFFNAEIKLESVTGNAIVFLKNYTGTGISDGFVEYSIPIADFIGLPFTNIKIPFSIWNPKDAAGGFVQAMVLIDDLRFE